MSSLALLCAFSLCALAAGPNLLAVARYSNFTGPFTSVYDVDTQIGHVTSYVGPNTFYGALIYSLSNCSALTLLSNTAIERNCAWTIMTWNLCNNQVSKVPAVSMQNTDAGLVSIYDAERNLIWWFDWNNNLLSSLSPLTGLYVGSNVTMSSLPDTDGGSTFWTLDTKRSLLYLAAMEYGGGWKMHIADLGQRKEVGVHGIPGPWSPSGIVYDPTGDRLLLNRIEGLRGEKSEFGVYDPVSTTFTPVGKSYMSGEAVTNIVFGNKYAVQCGGAVPIGEEIKCQWFDVTTNTSYVGSVSTQDLSWLVLDSSPNPITPF